MPEPLLDRAVANVADRLAVDWSALEREADSDDDRVLLDCLKILGGIGNLHRTLDLDTANTDRAAAAPDANDSRVPLSSMWGRFRIDAQVGEGGFGRVYRAWDPELEREVAIKILHRRIADTRMREALLREGRALAKIRHPHVINVLGVETRGDEIGLCMEFVHGQTLEDALHQHGPLEAREVALVGSDLCRALEAVHQAGFIHRDVKARNVMRDESGRVVLMDFGAGQQSQGLSPDERARMVGTPLYMAPELLVGQPATPASDIYSLGVLLYRLVSGEYPVEGKSLDEIRAAHMQGRRVPIAKRRAQLPAPFARAIDRALAADPLKRFESASALLAALSSVTAPLSLRQRLTGAALWVAGTVAALWVLGLLSSSFFNRVVGRDAPFDRESPLVWLEIGLRSVVAPAIYMAAMLLTLWTARWMLRILSLVPPLAAAAGRLRLLRGRLAVTLQLRSPDHFAQFVTAAGVIGLAVMIWAFWDLQTAMLTPISDAPAAELLPLRYDRRFAPAIYRVSLEVLFLSLTAALVHLKRTRAGTKVPARAAAPIWALLIATVLLAEVPYRLLWHNKAERIEVAGERCYSLGASATQILIHCPDIAPPRNRALLLGEPLLTRTGITESLFTPPAGVD